MVLLLTACHTVNLSSLSPPTRPQLPHRYEIAPALLSASNRSLASFWRVKSRVEDADDAVVDEQLAGVVDVGADGGDVAEDRAVAERQRPAGVVDAAAASRAELSVTVLPLIVSVPPLSMPPPKKVAELPERVLPLIVSVPPVRCRYRRRLGRSCRRR